MKELDRKAQQEILDYFDKRIAPSQKPRNYGKVFKSLFTCLWRYRIGDYYRAICYIEDENLTVLWWFALDTAIKCTLRNVSSFQNCSLAKKKVPQVDQNH